MKLALIGAGQRGMIYAEYAYFKKNGIMMESFHERFLCMAYYKGIATLMWHASIDDEESCTSIMKSISELEERIWAIK
jgi:hypothetical protein